VRHLASSERFFFSDVVDVFLSENPTTVHLLDFNPFGPTTDALLFDWDELNGDYFGASASSDDGVTTQHVPEFRYVSPGQSIPAPEYSRYQLPVDMVDLMNGEDPDKLVDFINLAANQRRRSDSQSSNASR
jgi:hypothetical protein